MGTTSCTSKAEQYTIDTYLHSMLEKLMKCLQTHIHANARGFTLVEMLVAIAIFSIVMIVAVGSLVSVIDANRKARSQQTVMNNIEAAFESMSRSIREGKDYVVSGSQITFSNPSDETVIFRLNSGRIERKIGSESFVPLTAGDVVIGNLTFEVFEGEADGLDKVLITLEGIVGEGERTESALNIQSTVAQRYRPAVATGEVIDPGESEIVCAFTSQAGRQILNLSSSKTESQTLLQDDTHPSLGHLSLTFGTVPGASGSLDLGEEVPAGYTITDIGVAGWDDHCRNGEVPGATQSPQKCTHGHNQQDEQFYVQLYDSTGALVLTSGYSEDIPELYDLVDSPDFTSSEPDLPIVLSNPIVGVRAIHCKGNNPSGPDCSPAPNTHNSHIPACIALEVEGTGSGGTIDIDPF